MKSPIYLLLLIFAVSFFLPAYPGGSGPLAGWACLWVCWEIVRDHTDGVGAVVYYGGFIVTNLAFVGLSVWGLWKPNCRPVLRWVALVPLLHVMSWWVVCAMGNESSFPNEIRYGYYVWLLAFAGLPVALFTKEPAPKMEDDSV